MEALVFPLLLTVAGLGAGFVLTLLGVREHLRRLTARMDEMQSDWSSMRSTSRNLNTAMSNLTALEKATIERIEREQKEKQKAKKAEERKKAKRLRVASPAESEVVEEEDQPKARRRA